MDNSIDRERIAKEIAKTSDSIRKKYCALKTGKMTEDIVLERYFKPIIDPLNRFRGQSGSPLLQGSCHDGNILFGGRRGTKTQKKTTERFVRQSYISHHASEISVESKAVSYALNEMFEILHPPDLSYDNVPSVEEIFEITVEPLVASIRQLLQTSEGQEKLHANHGPLVQKYMEAVLNGKKAVNIDVVYGAYFSDEGSVLDDKRITLHKNNNIIIDRKRHDGNSGLYELIFMKFPNESICTDVMYRTTEAFC
ncbi:hypothetical protein ALC57_18527 [Trachymyrmex cornetzi]|uniref:DUF8207 domain-containing protein n=1 Tax=Trachymyrmex cornetzi TaxID=471704 RepID=A0A151IRP1_9HYME|nr:hypothetical protein ALC57_18527 [Trachymyrmex cornetzi]